MYVNKISKIEYSFNIIVILLLILSTGTVLSQVLGSIIIGLSFLLILLLFTWKSMYSISVQAFYSIVLSLFLMLSFVFITLDIEQNSHEYYYKIGFSILIITLYTLYLRISKIDILYVIYLVLCFILIHSVLNLLFVHLYSDAFIYTIDKMDIKSLLYIFNYHSEQELFGFLIYRNQGIFWEPGILQIFINILLFLSIFIYKNKIISTISVIIIISTFSTTGMILMGLILLNTFNYRKMNFITFIVYLFIIFVMIYFIYLNIDDKIDTKFASIALRSYDFLISIEIIKDNILTGIGYYPDFYEKIQLQYNPMIDEFNTNEARGNTNSILMFATYFGLVSFIFYVISLYNQNIFREKKVLFFTIIIISLMSEPLALMNFFLLLYIDGAINTLNKLIRVK